MKRQRNYSQLKEQEKSPQRINNEAEIPVYWTSEFKRVVIKMLTKLSHIISINADDWKKELANIKMNKPTIHNSISEIKSNLEAMNS